MLKNSHFASHSNDIKTLFAISISSPNAKVC